MRLSSLRYTNGPSYSVTDAVPHSPANAFTHCAYAFTHTSSDDVTHTWYDAIPNDHADTRTDSPAHACTNANPDDLTNGVAYVIDGPPDIEPK